jgi:hypothetical protein
MSNIGKLGIFLLFSVSATAAEYHVDNVRGADTNPGDAALPFATITKAMSSIRSGDVIHLVANAKPYCEAVEFRGQQQAGTPEAPTVLDGHGAVIDGRKAFAAAEWKAEGDAVFSRPLGNNAWPMDFQGCWSGDFPIVFFDGKPGENCRTKAELAPFRYFLFKSAPTKGPDGRDRRDPLHNTLYVMLPAGKTPDDIRVEIPTDAKVYVERDNVIVRNIKVRYVPNDCFATCWGKNIVFDNIEGSYAMDQGISNHSGQALVKNSRFHHNAGCGIVDVVMRADAPCVIKYQNCLIEDNVYRGGIEFLGAGGRYELENCVVRNNAKRALDVGKGAEVKVSNCLFAGPGTMAVAGVSIGGGAKLHMTDCTVWNFATAFNWWQAGETVLTGNAIIGCKEVYRRGDASVVQSDRNYFCPAVFKINDKMLDFPAYQKASGQDAGSVVATEPAGELPPWKVNAAGLKVGAVLDETAFSTKE